MEEDEFSQGFILPPLITQLRKILDQYPDDTQILKELIQNAEDAGAKVIRFLYDKHSYGQDKQQLYNPGLARFQGPALYAYNDGLFDEEDWKGLRMLSDSVKQSDPFKVGYFGMGFKSVFHMTDLPSVISGDKLGMIDPNQHFFPASSHGWNIAKHPELLDTMRHQLDPYLGIFGCDEQCFRDGYYRGTLFRFPLRISPSALSSQQYTQEKIYALFESFKDEAHLLPLFLRNLEKIEVYERDRYSADMKLLFSVEVGSDCVENIRAQRIKFVEGARKSGWHDKPIVSTYLMTIDTKTLKNSYQDKLSLATYRFLITSYYCGGQLSAAFSKLHKDPELNFLPWVGTAMPLNTPAVPKENVYDLTDDDGHIFCFLPLPMEQNSTTGLPVHVNGFFALEQNRKHIKWPVTYKSRDELMDKRLLWNQCILKEALPKAYSQMLLEAIQMHASNGDVALEMVYRAFPDFGKVDRKWECILPVLYSELFKHPTVFTTAEGGKWIEPRYAVFNTLDVNEDAAGAILDVLTVGSVRIVDAPSHVLQAIKKCCHINIGQIAPTLLATTYRSVQYECSLQWDYKMKLLRYFLRQSKLDILDGLQLLPLANGGFEIFHYNPRKADRPIYIAITPEVFQLLPGLSDDFLDMEIDKDIKKNLIKAASKGFTQLKIIDAAQLGQLIPNCLPKSWQNGKGVVEWMPGEAGHPPQGWLELLWSFLVTNSPRDLSAVERLPLLPGRTMLKTCPETNKVIKVMELVPLSNSKASIVRHMDGISLGSKMEEIATKIGITVVDDLPDYIKLHPLITKSYIFSSSYIGVLRALNRLGASDGEDKVVERILQCTTADEKRCLRELFAKISAYEMLPEYQELLWHLPIFETLEGSGGGKESHFVSAAEVSLAAPCEKASFPLSRFLLDISSTESQTLARLLGIQQLNLVQLLTQVVFKDIENGFYDFLEVQKVMLYVLKHYHQFQEIDSTFQTTLSSLAFLEKKDLLLTADRFYDPDHELLQKMFQFEEKFPSGAYSDPAIVAILREIGLRGMQDVDADNIRESALCIEALSAQGDVPVEKLEEKASAVLEYLQRNQSKINADCAKSDLATVLCNIAWVRHMSQRPAFYPASLPWFGDAKLFNKPSDLTSKKHFNLVGSVMRVAALDVPGSIERAFGWDKTPPLEPIVQHLTNVVRSYDSREKVLYMELSKTIYGELTKHDISEVKSLLGEHVDENWIWNGEGFVSPSRIVFVQPFMDLRPFTFSLPAEMALFSEFFANFGVQRTCCLTDVLKMIRKKHNGAAEAQFNTIEVKRDLNVCVSILNELKSHITDEESLATVQSDLYLPVLVESKSVVLKMAPLQECTYCDEEWIRQGYSYSDFGMNDDEQHIALVHPNVPSSTSEALGVPTLMSRMLDAEELDISFGQMDSLTHRLNTLLQEYSDGFAVPKELIQNADDAGATEVKFLYDERENEDARTCLIDEGMRECQGVALWVYNDAVFEDGDFENITKLSGATKESQPEKIGRFGLGFNAVYNMTDVPSFVSRHNIVIFDPHLTHLGKSIKNKYKPGIRIDLRRHRKNLRRFGNQFRPYNEVFGCNLKPDSDVDFYDGTLFRFPLRTKAQALRSEICNKHYDDKEVKELLKMLASAGESLLLFTQNVLKITVYHLPKKGVYSRDLVEVFHLEKKPIKIIRELTPVPKLSPAAECLSDELKNFVSQCSVLKSSVEAMVHLKAGVKPENMALPDSSVLVEVERYFTPKCDFVLDPRMPAKNKKQNWLICNYLGTGESLRMALREENLLSTVGVAVLVEATNSGYRPVPLVDAGSQPTPSGSVFSYMPLPIRCGLPVHINGSFYVTSNRKYLCQQSEDDKFDLRPVWNNSLMRDAVCGVYVRLLSDLARLSDSVEDYDFHVLWPNPNHVSPICEPLLKGFYKCITTKGNASLCQLFSDGLCWKSIDNTMFLEFEYALTDVGKVAEEVFRLCISGTDSILASLPAWMKGAFELAGVQANLVGNTYDIVRFFHKIFLPSIGKVDSQRRDHLVMDALRQNSDHLNAAMADTECIPVTPNGKRMRLISDLIDPTSSLAQLYIAQDERFPYGNDSYCSFEILQVLRSIGLKHKLEHITWDDLMERASVIAVTPDAAAARTMVTGLLAIMMQKLAEDDIKTRRIPLRNIQEVLTATPFLPVMKKPAQFPLPWKGSDFPDGTLLKPLELYPSEHKDLIGCVRPIVDNSVFPANHDAIQKFLRISAGLKEPTVEEVLEQLDVIISPDSEPLLNTNDFDEIQRLSFKVCEFFQHRCGKTADRTILKNDLKTRNFILAHNRFLSPSQVAFKFSHNCAPYLYSLPDYHKRNFIELLSTAGVKDHFDTQSYVAGLQDLHWNHIDEELDRDVLKLALQMVSLLNDRMAEQGQTLKEVVDTHGAIYIPDAKGVLRSASELCYNEPDCHWVPTSDFSSFSHPLIPYAISKQLGVNTSRLEVLRKHSRGIPFGQRERLTNRIKRILSGYPCDKEILKELLQNADDAGATEITFIKDCRQHGTERVFDKSFRPLQGPALCVYSNRAFSETDLEAIQCLGEGSKGADPNKTGQYGVGFNCVYHLTDAPSFLTRGPNIGESLCIFDPHAKFVPGASKEEPGRRFQDVSQLRTIFTDVFSCYLEDRFDITNGTMFRFPLRDESMARDSELSDQVVSMETIDQLFAKFRPEMFDSLLFLNSITKISLTEIDKLTGKFFNTYTISAAISTGDEDARRNFSQYLTKVAAKLKTGEISLMEVDAREMSYTVTITDSKGYWEKWLISQQIGFEKLTEIHPSILDAFRRKELALMPRGGVAALVDASDKSMIRRRTKKIFCFLPLPLKSDLPVNINGHFALDHEARRSLWQDEDSGPKTEWNRLLMRKVIAPCYAVLMRRMAVELSDCFVDGNVSMMNMSDSNVVPGVAQFSLLFPRLTRDTGGYWYTLAEAVYQRIHETQERVLPVVRKLNADLSNSSVNLSEENASNSSGQAEVEWLATSDGNSPKPCFDHLDETFTDSDEYSARKPMTSTPVKTSRSHVLRHVLLASGFKLLSLPLEIYDSFSLAGVDVSYVSPSTVIDFYRLYNARGNSACLIAPLPVHVSATPFKNEVTLKVVLQYCLKDSYYFYTNLDGLPLLLTEDEQLRQFSTSSPVYLSPFHDLLPEMGHRFCHHLFIGSIFKETDFETCPAFIPFDVESFAKLLPHALSEQVFHRNEIKPFSSDGADFAPDKAWLAKVWKFLRHKHEQAMEPNSSELDCRVAAETVLSPLLEWSILPAHIIPATSISNISGTRLALSMSEDGSDKFLVPISMAGMLLDYSQAGIMSWPLKHCLRKLQVPELNCEILDNATGTILSPVSKNIPFNSSFSASSNNSVFAKLIVSTLEDPQSVLKAISLASKRDAVKVPLQQDECLVLLKYLSDSLESWKHNIDACTHLRNAPLHVTVQGDVTSLLDHCVYILCDDIPSCDLDAWQSREGIIFLQSNASLVRLYETLNCNVISVSRLYLDFIFKSFDYLSPEGRITHLEFLRDSYLSQASQEDRQAVFQALKLLEFIPLSDGSLHMVSEFFDPYHLVFKEMLGNSPSSFPSAPFSEFKWLDFLRQIGLQHNVSIDQFVLFANEVAEEGKRDPTEQTFNKSRTLVAHMFRMENLPNIGLLERIVEIPFIPAGKGKSMHQKIYPAFNSSGADEWKPTYIAFREGIAEQHEVLIWSSAYLLPDWANPYKLSELDVTIRKSKPNSSESELERYRSLIGSMLQVQQTPSIPLVVSHMLKLCSTESLNNEADNNSQDFKAYLRMDVMKRIYQYLQSSIPEDGDVNKELETAFLQLAEAPCIVSDLGQKFVKPKLIAIELYEEDQIIPYLYKAPTELGEFRSLFLRLGASSSATAEQYAMVLNCIREKTGDEKLHPNELRIVLKAVGGLFSALTKLQTGAEIRMNVKQLYLPTNTGHLLSAAQIIYNNEPSWTERIKSIGRPFLVNLAECKLTAETYRDTIKFLPEEFRPVLLSSVVKEAMEENISTTREVHAISEKLRYQLNSKAFAHGVARLIKHEHRRSGHRVKQNILEKMQLLLKNVQIYGVDRVVTYLLYGGKKVLNSESEGECFVDRKPCENDEPERWEIYVKKTSKLDEEMQVAVADAVNLITGGLLKNSVHYIQPILSCPPHSISKVLDRLKVRPDYHHSSDVLSSVLPSCGSFIPMEDHHLLKQDIVAFETGEYVGYELDDELSSEATFIYATIIKKVSGDDKHSEKSPEVNGMCNGGNHGLFMQKYLISVGDDHDPVLVPSTDLYKFERLDRYMSRSSMSTSDNLSGAGSSSKTPKTSEESFYTQSSVFEPVKEINGASKPDEVLCNGDQVVNNSCNALQKYTGVKSKGATKREKQKQRVDLIEEELADQNSLESDASSSASGETPELNGKESLSDQEEVGNERETIEQMMNEVSDVLEESWRLPEAERKKVIKRLLLKWHPDKNLDDQEVSTRITQHIYAEVERLELGLPRPKTFEEFEGQFDFDPRNPFAGSTTFQQNFYNAYQFFFEQLNRRAKEHKEQRERYKENFSREYGASKFNYNCEVPPTFSSTNPQPPQAKRFFRQAQEDLKAADNDYKTDEPAFEWVCFKAHQAAEKALKAAQFHVDAISSLSHDLICLAASLEDIELRRLAQQLQRIVGNSNKLYNPDPIDFIVIPHDEYTKEMSLAAVAIAQDILGRVKEIIEFKE